MGPPPPSFHDARRVEERNKERDRREREAAEYKRRRNMSGSEHRDKSPPHRRDYYQSYQSSRHSSRHSSYGDVAPPLAASSSSAASSYAPRYQDREQPREKDRERDRLASTSSSRRSSNAIPTSPKYPSNPQPPLSSSSSSQHKWARPPYKDDDKRWENERIRDDRRKYPSPYGPPPSSSSSRPSGRERSAWDRPRSRERVRSRERERDREWDWREGRNRTEWDHWERRERPPPYDSYREQRQPSARQGDERSYSRTSVSPNSRPGSQTSSSRRRSHSIERVRSPNETKPPLGPPARSFSNELHYLPNNNNNNNDFERRERERESRLPPTRPRQMAGGGSAGIEEDLFPHRVRPSLSNSSIDTKSKSPMTAVSPSDSHSNERHSPLMRSPLVARHSPLHSRESKRDDDNESVSSRFTDDSKSERKRSEELVKPKESTKLKEDVKQDEVQAPVGTKDITEDEAVNDDVKNDAEQVKTEDKDVKEAIASDQAVEHNEPEPQPAAIKEVVTKDLEQQKEETSTAPPVEQMPELASPQAAEPLPAVITAQAAVEEPTTVDSAEQTADPVKASDTKTIEENTSETVKQADEPEDVDMPDAEAETKAEPEIESKPVKSDIADPVIEEAQEAMQVEEAVVEDKPKAVSEEVNGNVSTVVEKVEPIESVAEPEVVTENGHVEKSDVDADHDTQMKEASPALPEEHIVKRELFEQFPLNRLEQGLYDLRQIPAEERRATMPYLSSEPSFKQVSQVNNKEMRLVASAIVGRVELEENNLKAEMDATRKDYLSQRAAWNEFCDKADKEIQERQEAVSEPPADNGKEAINGSHTNNAAASPQAAVVPNGVSEQHSGAATRPGRRGRSHHGSYVRSEAEYLEILSNLEQETARDPSLRARLTTAKVPDMIVDPVEREKFLFEDTNVIVKDKSVPFQRLISDPIDTFTQEEHEKFCEAYALYPKQFGKIATEMGGLRTYGECVMHYYQTKKKVDYKALLVPKRKTRKRVSKKAITTPGGGTAVVEEETSAPPSAMPGVDVNPFEMLANAAATANPLQPAANNTRQRRAAATMDDDKKTNTNDDSEPQRKRAKTASRGKGAGKRKKKEDEEPLAREPVPIASQPVEATGQQLQQQQQQQQQQQPPPQQQQQPVYPLGVGQSQGPQQALPTGHYYQHPEGQQPPYGQPPPQQHVQWNEYQQQQAQLQAQHALLIRQQEQQAQQQAQAQVQAQEQQQQQQVAAATPTPGESQFDQPNQANLPPPPIAPAAREKVSSYWSLGEVGTFERLLNVYGTHFDEYMPYMKNKSLIMLKNFFHKHSQDRNYAEIANAGDSGYKSAKGQVQPPASLNAAAASSVMQSTMRQSPAPTVSAATTPSIAVQPKKEPTEAVAMPQSAPTVGPSAGYFAPRSDVPTYQQPAVPQSSAPPPPPSAPPQQSYVLPSIASLADAAAAAAARSVTPPAGAHTPISLTADYTNAPRPVLRPKRQSNISSILNSPLDTEVKREPSDFRHTLPPLPAGSGPLPGSMPIHSTFSNPPPRDRPAYSSYQPMYSDQANAGTYPSPQQYQQQLQPQAPPPPPPPPGSQQQQQQQQYLYGYGASRESNERNAPPPSHQYPPPPPR